MYLTTENQHFVIESRLRKIQLASLAVAVAALPYSGPVCYAGIFVFLAFWVLEGKWVSKKIELEHNPLVWLLPAFFLLHLVGLWYTDDLQSGWANIEQKMFLLLVPVALASIRPLDKWELNTLFGTFTASLLIGTLICLGNSLSLFLTGQIHPNLLNSYVQQGLLAPGGKLSAWTYFSDHGLSAGIQLHPTYLALYLALCLLILLYAYRDNADDLTRRERIILYGIFSYFAIFIVLLNANMMTLATVVIVLVAAVHFILRSSKPVSRIVVGAVAVFICSLVFINPAGRLGNRNALFGTFNPESDPGRNLTHTFMGISRQVLHHVNPLFGGGTGDVQDLIQSYGTPGRLNAETNGYTSSNQFVTTWLALGAVGVVTLLMLFLVPIYFALRRQRFLTGAFVFLFLLGCLSTPALESPQGVLFFALFNSLFLFQQKGLQQAPPDELVFA